MPWARLDDGLNDDAKLNALSADAFRLWVRGLVYCQKNLTDGVIPEREIPLLGASVRERERPRVIGELCGVLVPGKGPLWHRVEGCYLMHDFLDWNDSRDKVLADRRKADDRQARFKSRGRFKRVASAVHNAVHNALRNALDDASQIAVENDVANGVSTYHVPKNEKQERADAPRPPVENREHADRLAAQIRQHRRRRSNETADGKPATTVITALARDVVAKHPDENDDGELRELLKGACARANLRYDSSAVGVALEQAIAQRRKARG